MIDRKMKKICKIKGCKNPHMARGWCNKHYARWLKHGDPTIVKYYTFKSPTIDNFLSTGEAKCFRHGIHKDWKFRYRIGKTGNLYRAIECRLCVNERAKKWREKNPKLFLDYYQSLRGIANCLMGGVRQRCKNYNINAEWIIAKYNKQNGCCALSKIPFSFEKVEKGRPRLYGMSLDQIKPKNGYTKDNTQLILWIVNQMKNNINHDEFIKICHAIANNTIIL